MCKIALRLFYPGIAILMLVAGTAFGDASSPAEKFNLTATLNYDSGYKLLLGLSNESDHPLVFHDGVLSRQAVTIIVARYSPDGGVLDGVASFDDPSFRLFALAPGEMRWETFDLESSFPSLRSELERHGLVLFWTAEISSLEKNPATRRFGGYLIIPQNK